MLTVPPADHGAQEIGYNSRTARLQTHWVTWLLPAGTSCRILLPWADLPLWHCGMVCSWRRHASSTCSRHTNHLQQTCRNSSSSGCPAARVVWPPCEEGQWHYLDLIPYLLLQACSTSSPSWGGLASPWRRSGHLAGSDPLSPASSFLGVPSKQLAINKPFASLPPELRGRKKKKKPPKLYFPLPSQKVPKQ